MVLQMEDCIDVLQVLQPDADFLLLFDHSCGHDRQREDGLNVENMSKGYGGKQSKLRPSLIKQVDGYLGPFSRKLSAGDTQTMVFSATDDGPFWMEAAEREEKRKDRVLANKVVKRRLTKDELIRKLQQKGVTATGNIKNLQRLCRNAQINLVETTQKTQLGWEGQPKGMLQILWERGWIDVRNLASYTVSGKKNELGVLEANTSLKQLLGSCRDFEEEESLLQSQGRSLGVTVDRTPKCHCELAGEGIEYSWGCAKNYYRQRPISEKRKKENFRNTVRACLSNDVLTTERVRTFSAGKAVHSGISHAACTASAATRVAAAAATRVAAAAATTTTTTRSLPHHARED